MNVALTTLSNNLYKNSRLRLVESARRFGITDIRAYDFEEIKETDFYKKNEEILSHVKTMGNWLWKPYIISEVLKTLSEGDIVIYCDSGIEIIADLEPVISICKEKEPILLFGNCNDINADFTKRDCFVLMECDEEKFWYGPHCDAAFTLFRKTDLSLTFLSHWLKYGSNKHIITDSPNNNGLENLPGYRGHRWDQSVLSLLAQKYQVSLYRIPTQFGNHYKMNYLRIENEFNVVSQSYQVPVRHYAAIPYYNSPYHQLLNHHRTKNLTVDKVKLAVVIPAYKAQFFEKTLSSLAAQTKKNFTVYVGDDCSPHNLEKICLKFNDELKINYTRFPDNIGAKNLVTQWKRCIALSGNEEWLWLFSDDDIADPTCVEKFYLQMQKDGGVLDIYRFNTISIDKEDNIISATPIGPKHETSEEMAYNLLLGKRGNSMPDHIFSRKLYEQSGGFVFTEYAQAADWATSILFAKEKGISIIPEAKLYWRYSGTNISSKASHTSEMLFGHLQFIEWILEHFKYLKKTQSSITYDMITAAAKFNLRHVIIHHYKGFGRSNAMQLIKFMHEKFGMSYEAVLRELLLIKESTNPMVGKIVGKLYRLKRRLYASV